MDLAGGARGVVLVRMVNWQRIDVPVLEWPLARRGPARRSCGSGHRWWLVCVDARIIGLHSVAAIRKLLKLRFDVHGRLAHWAAAGGDDGALSGPPGGGLLLRQAAVAYRWAALWMLNARSRGGGWWRVARRRWRRGRGRLCLPGLLHRAFVTLVQLPKYLTRAGVRAGLAWARRRLQRRRRRWPAR